MLQNLFDFYNTIPSVSYQGKNGTDEKISINQYPPRINFINMSADSDVALPG